MLSDIVSALHNAINGQIMARIAEENKRIDDDVRELLGWRIHCPRWLIKRLGYEVILQQSKTDGIHKYRGIQHHGKWIIDHGSKP